MWPFDKKQVELPMPAPKAEELVSMVEMLNKRGLAATIEATMQKQIDNSQYFQAYENADDHGNFFGTEFNILATAGRIKGTYSREPWVFATASLIARTLASVPFVVKDVATGEIDDKHPLNQKLTLGNRIEDGYALNWKGYLDLVLGGNFFRVFNDTYTEAFLAPVEETTLRLDPRNQMVESVIMHGAQSMGVMKSVPYSQCIHHKYPNPYNPFYGLSIFTAASRPILLDRYKQEFEMAFYLRGATNAGVIETTEDINKSRMERLMATFEAVYTGKRNWWRTIFLPKGAKWVQSGLTMSEMQHLEGLRENRLAILAVLGVPPSQVGIVADVNRATAETQERALWMNTITPMAQFVAAGWNNSHLVKTVYGGRVCVEPDFSEVQALQGSLMTKGEQAKSVENYLWVDEIRTDILGYDPLPNGAGQKFVSEVKPAQSSPFGLSAPVTSVDPVQEVVDTTAAPTVEAGMKVQAVSSQERIETKLSKGYLSAYAKYIDSLLTIASKALADNRDVAKVLAASEEVLTREYIKNAEASLVAALERGFSFASSQAKAHHDARTFKTPGVKRLRFRDVDQQAIDALRDTQRDGKRTQLVERGIASFVGFNKTRTTQVLDVIAEGLEKGETTETIATTLRQTYGEKYKDQAFTIARTELLTAVSQGIKWNHDVLGDVFSDVQKQWFHVGDVGSNPDAREQHAGFENEGPVPKDYKWGSMLEYPRDSSAPADQTINCRCSMVSVIPDNAESNAEVILDRL